MDDSGGIDNNLEMHPSGRNEGPPLLVIDKFFKSPFLDGDR